MVLSKSSDLYRSFLLERQSPATVLKSPPSIGYKTIEETVSAGRTAYNVDDTRTPRRSTK